MISQSSTNSDCRVLLISRKLSADPGFRQVLNDAGLFVYTGRADTEAMRTAVKKVPRIVVVELGSDEKAGESLVSFIDDYTRSHDAVVFILSESPAPVLSIQGPRSGSVRWIDGAECGPDGIAHIVVDAAGSLRDFDMQCAVRFGNERAAAVSPETANARLRAAHVKWAAVPDDQKGDQIDGLIDAAGEVERVAGLCGLARLCQVARAVRGLAEKVRMIPQRMNASISRTLQQAMDLLPSLTSEMQSGDGSPALEPRVLVLDDIAMIRRLHCSALENVNVTAVAVDDPARALELFDTERFDLVFLDIHMPRLDGFLVCEALRESRMNARTPAIFVTGLRDLETRNRSEASGAIDFIAKPVLHHELGLKALIHLYGSRRVAAA